MKNRLSAFLIILLSLFSISCDFSIADFLNEKLDLTPPIYLSYKTEYGKTPSRKPVQKGDAITEDMLPEVAFSFNDTDWHSDDEEYSFAGWYYDEGYTQVVNVGDVIEGAVTLYAKWQYARVYIYFNVKNGYLEKYYDYYYKSDSAVYTMGYTTGTVLSSSNLPEPCYYSSAYIFLGWYLDPYFETPAEGYVLESDITLYAKERYDGYCTISYSSSWYSDQPEYKSLKAGEKLDSYYLPELTPYQEYENYVFMGWYYDYNYTHQAREGDEVNSDITLYAKWEQRYVDIYYSSNYSFAELPESIKIEKGSSLISDYMPDLTPLSGYEDYRFAGWYYDLEAKNKAQVGDVIDRDIIFYAKWEILYFKINYETSGYAEPIEQKVVNNNGSGLTADLLPEVEAYYNLVFAGWYYDLYCEMPASVGDIVKEPTIWLYAKYDVIPDGTFVQYWVFDDSISDDYEVWDTLTKFFNESNPYAPVELRNEYYHIGYEILTYDSFYYDDVEYTNGYLFKEYYVKREISSIDYLTRLLSLISAYDYYFTLSIPDTNPDLEQIASVLRNNNTMRCRINLYLCENCYQLTSIPENCFKDVPYLTGIFLPSSLQTIEKNAFKGCTDLTFINMYPYVTLIDEAAFEGCPLDRVDYRGDRADRENMTINDTTILNAYWYYNW